MDCSIISQIANTPLFSALLFAAEEAAGEAEKGISWEQYGVVLLALAVIILPFVVGGFLAKQLKMPTHATRIGFILLAVIGSAAVLINKRPGRGVDLRGGTILVYEIDPSKNKERNDENGNVQQIKSEDLVEPLINRVNPSGTREIVIRPYGTTQIEVIVPEVDQREVAEIKKQIADTGVLQFAIVANRMDHQRQLDLATERSQSQDPRERLNNIFTDDDGESIAIWAIADRERTEIEGKLMPYRVDLTGATIRNSETGELINLPPDVRGVKDGALKQAQWIDQNGINGVEILMIVDPIANVTGEDLAFASTTFDERGAPAVSFTLTDRGSAKFLTLTTDNAPTSNGRERQLGIVLDERLLSAPSIQSPIQKEGRITGRFTQAEVESLVNILKAGQLPAALTEQPIAENQIDATLGADTIQKGMVAIGTSLGLVLLFIIFYYRFAGVVACIALVLNLAMILATMVFINQPLTLPGLAGLVLTVGMSVDANVLIFERIREELKKGAKSRMAIRNGFAKATVTIVDANLTTLLTAIVLYAIGTDQIRGFAVTLILGILFSMFTAIYMSRTFFDIAERQGFLSLNMSDGVNSIRSALSGEGNLDFVGKGRLSLALSLVLVLVGIGALYARGKSILDIDFAGGSSVQFRVDNPLDHDEVKAIVAAGIGKLDDGTDVDFTVNAVSMEGAEQNTVYKVDSALDTAEKLQNKIIESFAANDSANLLSYGVEISGGASPTDQSFIPEVSNGTLLTAARSQESDESADANDDSESASAEASENETAADQPTENAEESNATGESESAAADLTGSDPEPALSIQSATRIVKLSVEGTESDAQLSGPTLRQRLEEISTQLGMPLNERAVVVEPLGEGSEDWNSGSSVPFSEWKVQLPMDEASANKLMTAVEETLSSEPIWVSSSAVGGRVASQMVGRAGVALFASLIAIVGYIWFRFQRVIYGFAAVAALVHDVLITLGAIAISFWLADVFGFLLIDPFKISLTVVAALLTIIGYSLNDTIVVFDRIRETKGKGTAFNR